MYNFPEYEDIKLFFDWGCYSKKDLADYVKLGCITAVEYEQICKEVYEEQPSK